MPSIRELARVCKSKNAGPFDLTIDIVFDDPALYQKVRATGVITEALFARLYGVAADDVLLTPYDAAMAIKATFPRLVPAGGIGDTDVYGCQQHAPLLDVEIPVLSEGFFLMPNTNRQMTMVAFLQAQNCSNLPGSWRHPASMSDFLTPDYYQRIARILEDGKFHMAFFDDRLAMPDIYANDFRNTVAHGVRAVKLDPLTIVMMMAAATKRIGLGATYSTTYYEPYHVARLFATADLMTRGRVAWNIVTSLNNSEALNFGHSEHLEHDLRYDRADEFMEVVMGHWGAWDDDALIVDKESGAFAKPDGVRRLDHQGKYFKSRGPFTVPRSPQGHPVLLQAGQSGRGRSFAARWGEAVFVIYPNLENGKKQYKEFRAAVAAEGRDPDSVKILPACYAIPAESADMAAEKQAVIEATARPIDGLTLLSEVLNWDLGSKPYDEPLTDDELAGLSWHGFRDRVIMLSGKKNPSVRDFVEVSGRGTIHEHHAFVGTPKQVADQMEEWFHGGACDGFVMAATHIPGAYEDFVRLVVPELQRRGVFHKDYPGSTLRDIMGLKRPSAAECRAAGQAKGA